MTSLHATGITSPRRTSLIDRALGAAAQDVLKHDDRVNDLDVDVRFVGGVAHLTGDVPAAEDLEVLRDLIGKLAGVHGVWDRVRVDGRAPRIVDLGCGDTTQYEGNAGIDRFPAAGVDVIADLTEGVPLADGSVDRVFAVHVLEHLVDYLPLLDECHRVLSPGGILHVMSPDWRHVNAVADPTHLRFFDMQTFKAFCRPRPGGHCWYPLLVSVDGATVFADLVPVKDGRQPADEMRLARFFD
jgi:SAM-dependent methyltransferase